MRRKYLSIISKLVYLVTLILMFIISKKKYSDTKIYIDSYRGN